MRIPGTTHSDTPGMEPKQFMRLLHTNVTNARLTDKAFRKFVADSLEVVEYERPEIDIVFAHTKLGVAKKVYPRLKEFYPAINFGLSVLEEKGVIWIREGLLSPNGLTAVSLEAGKMYQKVRREHGNNHNRTRATKPVRRKADLRRSR